MIVDIQQHERNFLQTEDYVQASALSARNKALIMGYRNICLIRNVCGKTRLTRAMFVLVKIGTLLNKDFDTATKADFERVIGELLLRKPRYSPQTISTFKAVIRTFMTWVVTPDAFPTKDVPAIVAWIHSYVRARERKRLERKDLLTPQEVDALLAICHNTRDKALVAMLWETGARVAEIGNLQIKHVTKQQFGYTLDLNGKTGQRNPLIISSASPLTVWLNNHPFAKNPESPLWVHYQYNQEAIPLLYASIRKLLMRLFERARIAKPFHPHIFRHSRATHVLAHGIMNEQQAKAYFGWTADSSMLATYSHLIDQDANDAIMRENNVAPPKIKHEDLKPLMCHLCKELNPPQGTHCTKCGSPLRADSLYAQRPPAAQEAVLEKLLNLLVRQGLTADTIAIVHDAGLGPTLQRLNDDKLLKIPPPAQPTQQTV